MRATPSTSPFAALADSISASVAACIRITPLARATRCVSALAATSTMWAWPLASKWLSGWDSAAGMRLQRRNVSVASYEARAGRRAPARSQRRSLLMTSCSRASMAEARRRSWRGVVAAVLACALIAGRPGLVDGGPRPEQAARARRHRLGRLQRRHRAQARRRDHARDPRRPRLRRRPAAARVPRDRLAAARRRLALARQHHRRHRSALRLGAVPGPRSERQRVRAAGRIRRRAPRPDRDDGDARRARLGARARDVARLAAPHRAQHLGRCEALAGRPGGARARPARGVAQPQPRRHERGRRRHPGRRRSRGSSTSRATSSARPTGSASRS